MMDKELILWASFLHDMGKLFQKCPCWETPDNDETDTKKAFQEFLKGKSPEQKWFPGIFQEHFNQLFLLSYYSCEGNIEEGKASGKLDESVLPYVKIISRADQLSGWETEVPIPLHQQQLISIFSKVKVDELFASENYFLPLTHLSADETMFPKKSSEGNVGSKDFDELLKAFIEELKEYFKNKDDPDFETFYYLAQKYLWCIPSPHLQANPDVSFFEHVKAVAAIAAILLNDYEESKNEAVISDSRVKRFALVGFDISGIQDFIYTIASKGAAKSLKGRSFYLQLLEMAISRYMLDCFALPVTNIIYCGGGKGFVLAPAAKMHLMTKIEENINDFLFKNLDTKVFVGTAYEPFNQEGFKQFNQVLENLILKMDKKKKQKFSSILQRRYKDLFAPENVQIQPETCSICGKEEKPVKEDEDGVRWCSQCSLFKELGTHLRQAAAISEGKEKTADSEFPVEFDFRDRKYCYEFITVKNLAKPTAPGKILYCLNQTGLFSKHFHKETRTGFLFTAGNQVPTKNNSWEVMEFSDMADDSTGAKKLGVVRGDVDNLGLIFARGLGEKISMGRVSQLSFLMKHFFSSMANLYFKKERCEFIVYSGGDDFFVIGPWDRLIDDLITFRRKFADYTCQNPAFSFSASFTIYNPRYPAFKFAEVAGYQEKKAKENQSPDEKCEKNSISFLDKIVFWEDFYQLHDLEKKLVEMIKEKGISRSYIQLLQRIAQYNSLGRMKPVNENELRQHARFHRWKWYYAWQVARMLERVKRKKEVEIPLKQINDFLFSSIYDGYRFINKESLYLVEVPARWAELSTRTIKSKLENKNIGGKHE
jgi:CRISPR-associated protein Csm1